MKMEKCLLTGVIFLSAAACLMADYQVFVNFTQPNKTTIAFAPFRFKNFFDCLCQGKTCNASYDRHGNVISTTLPGNSNNVRQTCLHYACQLITRNQRLECSFQAWPSCYSSGNYQNIQHTGATCGNVKCVSLYWVSNGTLDYSQATPGILPCQDNCGCLTTAKSSTSTTTRKSTAPVTTKTTLLTTISARTVTTHSAAETNTTDSKNATMSDTLTDNNTTPVIIGVVVAVVVILVAVIVVVVVLVFRLRHTKLLQHKTVHEPHEYVNAAVFSVVLKDRDMRPTLSDSTADIPTEYVNYPGETVENTLYGNATIYQNTSDTPTVKRYGSDLVYSKAEPLDNCDKRINAAAVDVRNNQTQNKSSNHAEEFHYDSGKNVVDGFDAEPRSVYELAKNTGEYEVTRKMGEHDVAKNMDEYEVVSNTADLRDNRTEFIESFPKQADTYSMAQYVQDVADSLPKQADTYSIAQCVQDVYSTVSSEDAPCDTYESVYELQQQYQENPDHICDASNSISPERGIYFELELEVDEETI